MSRRAAGVAHLETPACACAPAGRGQDMAPADTSSHGLSAKHITAHQRKATLTSTTVGLFSSTPLHQPADTELQLNFFLIIKMSKVTYDFISASLNKPLEYAKTLYFSMESLI